MAHPSRSARPRPDASDRVIAIAAVLGLIGAVLTVRTLVALRSTASVEPPRYGVDPNAASWSDLALLPEIGEQTARAIIAYRDAQRHERTDDDACIFRRREDLLPVKGIGPKTLQSIAHHLRFDSCP